MTEADQFERPQRGQNISRWENFKRACRYRLVVPLKRSVHSPEHVARGVAVGVAWALTPTVGIQMIFCLATWVVAKRLFNWDFHLIISLAWTWITNVATLLPSYYLFFLTGQLMLGRFDDLSGYNEFISSYEKNVAAEGSVGYWEEIWLFVVLLFKGWGVPMLIGCVPWAALGGWAGYVWSLKFIKHHRESKQRRAERRREKLEAMTKSSPPND
ncbi:MAG: hypothetical protein CMM52_06015 [Rhodospirillaceae bacterium]|nr:hypothetical protein [Rhodospirillaceae bacterium]|tara:strand:- start:21483 stop:22124 length:642 start_codon:yes stop_codon:yes gene_type:complete